MAPTAIFTFKNSVFTTLLLSTLLSQFSQLTLVRALCTSFAASILTWTTYRCLVFPYFLSPLRDIPTVSGLPILGNILTLLFSEFGTPQRKWHEEHGPIIRYIYCFGSERLSVINDEAVKQITVKDVYNFVKPKPVQDWMSSVLGRGVLLVDGAEHVRQRKVLSPAFSTASIRDLTPVFWSKGKLLTKLLLDNVKSESTPVEVLDWLNRATLDVIGAAAFGYEINSLLVPNSPLRDAYSSVFAFDLTSHIVQTLNNICSWSKYIPVKINRDMASAVRTIKDVAAAIIHDKLNGQARDKGAKDIMALVTKQNSSPKEGKEDDVLSFDTMRDQIMTFLGAGHDTTATGVMWTLDLLSKHPHVQERLRKEILDAYPVLRKLGTNEEEEDQHSLQELLQSLPDVDQLPYLNNVCRESLRYIPPIPLTIRENLEPTTLCGHVIPAGTWMYVIANVMNRAPAFWGSDADRFDPDRWDRLPPTYTTNAYMTFLHGPRGCIGRKFAETEMKVFLCCLLARLRFERDLDWPDQELHKMWRLVLKPKHGMHMRLSRVD